MPYAIRLGEFETIMIIIAFRKASLFSLLMHRSIVNCMRQNPCPPVRYSTKCDRQMKSWRQQTKFPGFYGFQPPMIPCFYRKRPCRHGGISRFLTELRHILTFHFSQSSALLKKVDGIPSRFRDSGCSCRQHITWRSQLNRLRLRLALSE